MSILITRSIGTGRGVYGPFNLTYDNSWWQLHRDVQENEGNYSTKIRLTEQEWQQLVIEHDKILAAVQAMAALMDVPFAGAEQGEEAR